MLCVCVINNERLYPHYFYFRDEKGLPAYVTRLRPSPALSAEKEFSPTLPDPQNQEDPSPLQLPQPRPKLRAWPWEVLAWQTTLWELEVAGACSASPGTAFNIADHASAVLGWGRTDVLRGRGKIPATQRQPLWPGPNAGWPQISHDGILITLN